MMIGQAIGAVVAQQLYTLWVGGSNPSSPTILCVAVPCQFTPRGNAWFSRLQAMQWVGINRASGKAMSATWKASCCAAETFEEKPGAQYRKQAFTCLLDLVRHFYLTYSMKSLL
jgi:hypothetical protein